VGLDRSARRWHDRRESLITYIRELGTGAGQSNTLSASARTGQALSRSKGCASCHGNDGEGGIGGPIANLWGTIVELDDGTTVLADEAYVVEAIVDPGASRPEGSTIPMPETDLSDGELDALVDYIRELGTTPEDSS